jgi:hypothetical protein
MMFDEEFEYDKVTSFLSSIEDFSKVRKQRREVKDEEESLKCGSHITNIEDLKSVLRTQCLVGEGCELTLVQKIHLMRKEGSYSVCVLEYLSHYFNV